MAAQRRRGQEKRNVLLRSAEQATVYYCEADSIFGVWGGRQQVGLLFGLDLMIALLAMLEDVDVY